MWTKRMLCLVAAVLVALGCFGCSARKEQYITCLDDMKDKELNVGVPDDLDLTEEILAVCPGAKLLPQNDILAINSVASGKLDCYIGSRFILEGYLKGNSNSGLAILDEPLIEYYAALGLSDSTPLDSYVDRVNQCIA